jgi:carboxylesterase type B
MLLRRSLAVALYSISCSTPAFAQLPGSGARTVTLTQSGLTFKGTSSNNVESFLNIRFGQDTSGMNRFNPPKLFKYPQNATIDSSKPGAACPQQRVPVQGFPIFDNVTNISEDCLTLRVDRPANTTSEDSLPVMVYIYGGGDTIGQIYDSAYDPTYLVSSAAQKGFPVIYVAMNYRLGIFGFASSSALAASDSLNVGLLDQRLALAWVQEYISAFGGNPRDVTIFGESDGATGVGLQITAYGENAGTSLFRRAIMQSGGVTADPGTASNISAVHTAAIVDLLNCTASTNEVEIACLRALSLDVLLPVLVNYELTNNAFGFDVFIPTSPSTFIPRSPSELLYSGSYAHDIDIIVGWNEDEGSFFTPTTLGSDADVAIFLKEILPGLSNQSVQEALALYPITTFSNDVADNVSSQYFRASQMFRDAEMACPSLLMIEAQRNYSATATSNYMYALNQSILRTFYEEIGAPYYGISHFSDIPYVFNQATTRYVNDSSQSDVVVSSNMSGSWALFASTGKPSGRSGTLDDWQDAIQSSSLYHNQFNVRIIGGPNDGSKYIDESGSGYEDLARRCRFWNSKDILREMQV